VADAVERFAASARRQPGECVAVVDASGELKPLENIHPEPETNFRVGEAEWIEALERAALVVHSHPKNEPSAWTPSESDQRSQIAHRKPWAIVPPTGAAFVIGAEEPSRALVGRGFRHGVDDCFGIVRDAWQRWSGTRVPNFPRRWRWWADGEPLIENGLAALGFVPVAGGRGRRGDVVALKLRGPVYHHLAFLESAAEMLHHPSPNLPYDPTVLSRTESAERWLAHPHTIYRGPAK
jgi:proteasome lid subunit RPN8/RPN11